jgi:hypothetical protein
MMDKELSETCRVSFQTKFEELVYLVGSVIRKFVTMHGYMNVKLAIQTLAVTQEQPHQLDL